MAIEFTLENILAVVIALITLNLLFIGFYIVSVLREVKKTVHRAGEVIDEVDRTVKDGIDKAKAMNAPLQALATTASAFGGIVKTSEVIKKATQSILGTNSEPVIEPEKIEAPVVVKSKAIETKVVEMEEEIEPEVDLESNSVKFERETIEVKSEPKIKKDGKRPRFFRGKRI